MTTDQDIAGAKERITALRDQIQAERVQAGITAAENSRELELSTLLAEEVKLQGELTTLEASHAPVDTDEVPVGTTETVVGDPEGMTHGIPGAVEGGEALSTESVVETVEVPTDDGSRTTVTVDAPSDQGVN